MGKIEDIASTHLGQRSAGKTSYDPSLLVKIPRQLNRDHYHINPQALPFVGFDVWHAYEMSVMTEKGLPVNGVLKIIVPANTECLVESKSLKLYLNAMNLDRLGKNEADCIALFTNRVSEDLSQLLEANINCHFYTERTQEASLDFIPLSQLCDLDAIEFSKDNAELKQLGQYDNAQTLRFQSNLLRSNCRVTHQPDWGDVFIHVKTSTQIDFASVAQYIVSHRSLNHFHEEICEMLYMHFQKAYTPEELMVMCLYTRRGGIDINPVRASDEKLIPSAFTHFETLIERTFRQ